MDFKRALRQLAELKRLGGSMRLAAEAWGSDWKCLIATIMSAQSRDETTIKIAERLFEKYSTLERLSMAEYSDVLHIFSGLNYNRTKARNVIDCARIVVSSFDGVVPRDLDKLILLPGVGRKTANVFLSEHGFDGMAVDTHVLYLARKLARSKRKNPQDVERD